MLEKPKIIVILGPTASGKSDLAVEIAKKINGEIISADSRQVYRGMDIGTGKVPRDKNPELQILNPKQFPKYKIQNTKYIYLHQGVPHYLLDVASPKRRFSVAQYKNLAQKAIEKILAKGKLPIICGGTGFYIQAVTENLAIPEVKPDLKIRARLEKKTTQELFEKLKKLDPVRAKNIDPDNPRRLIRALEIICKTGKAVPPINPPQPSLKGGSNSPPLGGVRGDFNSLFLGIKKSPDELKKLISKRLKKRLKQGMIREVEQLRQSGLSWKRLEDFGLEYRWLARFLQKKISRQAMPERLEKEIWHYAKRQMTWFRRSEKQGVKIYWLTNSNRYNFLVKNFLKK